MKKKYYRQSVCLLLAILLLGQITGAGAQTSPAIGYATDSVRLRARPSSTATILDVIQKGDAVLVSGTEGNYYSVEYEGQKGYAVTAFINVDDPSPQEQSALIQNEASGYITLSGGSTGAAVKALQEALSELRFYTMSIDSKYGRGTEQAVRAFQEKNGLTASGIADAASQALIFEGEPINTQGVKTNVKTLPPIPGFTMRLGDKGEAVGSLQQKLKNLSFYKGLIDSSYGSSTQTAVRDFQRANSLTVDGIAGAETQARLDGAGDQLPAGQTPPPTNQSNVFVTPPPGEAVYPYSTTTNASVNLRKSASASAMRYLTIPEGGSIQVLEDSGSYLKVSYKEFSGFVDKNFVHIPEQYLEGKSLGVSTDARVKYETLGVGSEGKKVRALQQALAELGYYSNNIDGKFGAGTISALKSFQKKNGLRETGIALPELQQLLFEKRVRNSKSKLVSVKTLPPVEGITMSQGDYGDAVYELHQKLVITGHYDGTVGYEFTGATAKAVRAFQKAHKIRETGRADSFTMLAIQTSIEALQPNKPPVQTPVTGDTIIVIRSGTRGAAVTRLQARLVELGYYNITPDGIYNSDDIAAVRQFQRVNGLNVSNTADLATQQTLYASYALRADSQTGGAVQTGGSLKIGTFGDAVKAMQSRLVTLKYLSGTVDGIFGTQTAAAVTSFQRTNSLTADGIAGPQTLQVLYSANAKALQTQATATPQPGIQKLTSLKIGDTGSTVVSMQLRLTQLNYLSGNADGIYGPRTFLAVKAFQEKNKLENDGIAGPLTLARLNSATAVAASGVIPPVTPIPQPNVQVFTAPKAGEVRFANWYTEIKPIASRLRSVVIYDFVSGKHYNFRLYSLGKHADGTTVTKEDTAVMNSVLGVNNWTPRPVWVIFSDGRVYMASTHSHGHETDYIADNNLTGHLCIHFPREMEEAALTGPYAVSHQNAILAGWDLTQNKAK